ncbi:energy transducer TonB [Xanthomonas sp. PPL568]|uniref:energy transducer TonB n=1 Tax=Xanthomonas indica TaxID=2912242 RepID=UPI001F57E336|nr:energy transducer TonB [Xanthomonas indica]MCI2245041.1 energy transducer TonB [Xanthomonas indica]
MHRRSLCSWWRWSALVALLLAFAAVAADGVGPGAVRKQIESSMLVSGTIDIEPSGKVSALALDQQERLPKGVVDFVRSTVMQWTFAPGMRDGKPVPARAPMTLRLVAKRQQGDDYQVEIRGADFSHYDPNDRSVVTSIQMKPPAYPEAAYSVGAAGSAYLVLKVGRDGRVADAAVEQVNLRVVASERQMQQLRDVLGKSALGAARKWTFRPPSEGKDVDAPYWTVRVPVDYALLDQSRQGAPSAYGRWMSYIPGPRQRAPWITSEDATGFSPDLLPAGGVYMADGAGPRLLTPLQGG